MPDTSFFLGSLMSLSLIFSFHFRHFPCSFMFYCLLAKDVVERWGIGKVMHCHQGFWGVATDFGVIDQQRRLVVEVSHQSNQCNDRCMEENTSLTDSADVLESP